MTTNQNIKMSSKGIKPPTFCPSAISVFTRVTKRNKTFQNIPSCWCRGFYIIDGCNLFLNTYVPTIYLPEQLILKRMVGSQLNKILNV